MNSILVSLILSIGFGFSAPDQGQTAPKPEGKVVYQFVTNLKGIPVTRTATLYFNQSSSVFLHSQGKGPKLFDASGNEVSMEVMKSTDVTNKGRLFDGFIQDPIGNVYFKDFAAKELQFREIVMVEPFLVQEPDWIEFDWKLEDGQKKIGRFNCQKASTHFRGRDYTAWYTTDVPVSNGPWKFHGLSGLILEVEDASGEVAFQFQSIEIPLEVSDMQILPPTDGKKADLETFMEAERKMQEKIVQAQRAKAARDRNAVSKSYEVGLINRVEKKLD
ncbi:MAG: GLPGLI family protein [Bacteroidota bacterium]